MEHERPTPKHQTYEMMEYKKWDFYGVWWKEFNVIKTLPGTESVSYFTA